MTAFFYIILSYLIIPILILRLYVKSIRNPAYRYRIFERFACFSVPPNVQIAIWIHTVSLGEVIAIAPLVESLLKEFPEKGIVLTTTTPTGSQKAQDLFKNRVFHVYSPFDAPFFVKRFLNKTKPQLAVFMETEIWPNWYQGCKQKNIPILIANARLSEKSQKGYSRIGALTRKTLNCIDKLLAQTKEDASRFVQLGLPKEKAHVLGNIKFDLTIPSNIYQKAQEFRSLWGKNRLVWLAGSTHQGEEEIILNAAQEIKQQFPDSLLILVPRHPERFDKIADLSEKMGFKTLLRTHLDAAPPEERLEMDVLLGNTIGEMMLFISSSDVAFIGGSLIPRGGHNILEPAALYVPVITGPHMFNFQKIYDEFSQSESVITVTDAASLSHSVISFFNDPHLREEYASRGFKIIEKNQGALEKHLAVFRTYLQ